MSVVCASSAAPAVGMRRREGGLERRFSKGASAQPMMRQRQQREQRRSMTTTRAGMTEANELASIAASSGGLETARAVVGVATVALIMFQGPKGDGVVNSLNEGRVFGSASQAKSAVDYVTYGLIGGFLVLSVVLAASG